MFGETVPDTGLQCFSTAFRVNSCGSLCINESPAERRLLQHVRWCVRPPCNLSGARCCPLPCPLCSTTAFCSFQRSIRRFWTGTWSRTDSSVPWCTHNLRTLVTWKIHFHFIIKHFTCLECRLDCIASKKWFKVVYRQQLDNFGLY